MTSTRNRPSTAAYMFSVFSIAAVDGGVEVYALRAGVPGQTHHQSERFYSKNIPEKKEP